MDAIKTSSSLLLANASSIGVAYALEEAPIEDVITGRVAVGVFLLLVVTPVILVIRDWFRRKQNADSTTVPHLPASQATDRLTEPQLTTGKMVGPSDDLPSLSGRRARCPTCGQLWWLQDARRVCLDWDGVDAYHYYCPICYIGTGLNYYRGKLEGAGGSAVVDQKHYLR
jgi:hypothetical protein